MLPPVMTVPTHGDKTVSHRGRKQRLHHFTLHILPPFLKKMYFLPFFFEFGSF
jgi:hypothetical protein